MQLVVINPAPALGHEKLKTGGGSHEDTFIDPSAIVVSVALI